MALRHQHALDFSQYLVRIRGEFEYVRHDDQVDRVGRERQFLVAVDDRDAPSPFALLAFDDKLPVGGAEAQWHPVLAQRIDFGQSQL